ncbi:DUF551 domain-containing protein [Klebsiella quasipneumoniae]|uniref:DUF551 domain-containing protein n=1 Tax=Klebsiella quasipneumoniae TaxID=1463165 RepID=UPI003F8D0F75
MTSKFSIDNRELLQRISSGEAVVGIDFGNLIVRELAAFRLAAMDSEPVAIIDQANLDYLLSGADADVWPPECEEMGDVLLYRHAQPVPRVPDGYVMVPVKPTREILDEFDSIIDYGAEDSEDAWRRLLAAAPHYTPALNSVQSVVTVPGKWIPVSERMPEDRTQVILWDAEIGEVTSGHYSHKTQTFYHCGDAIENEITHWMPPPCAPQEVK